MFGLCYGSRVTIGIKYNQVWTRINVFIPSASDYTATLLDKSSGEMLLISRDYLFDLSLRKTLLFFGHSRKFRNLDLKCTRSFGLVSLLTRLHFISLDDYSMCDIALDYNVGLLIHNKF